MIDLIPRSPLPRSPLSLSARSLQGVAALYMREGVHWCPMLVGGGQERGLRAGTENVALIAGLGEASRLAREEADALLLHMLTLKVRR